jgi:hypothetical protein
MPTDPPAPDLGGTEDYVANVAAKRQSQSVYNRVEYWLVDYSWVNPDEFEILQALAEEIVAEKARVDAQAAQLAAVSDALMYAISIICNIEHPTVTQDVPWEPLRRRFLDQAHAALGLPAAELASQTEAPGAPPAEGAHG